MMPHQLILTAMLSMMVLSGACKLSRDFQKDQDKSVAAAEPDTQAKGDRPQETGEGLPGYLIDAELLTQKTVGDETQISGAVRAVRSRMDNGTPSQKILFIGYKKEAKAFRRDNKTLILKGRLITSLSTQADGSFMSNARLENAETLFIRLADTYTDAELAFVPGNSAIDRVMLDPITGKFVAFDEASTQRISYDIDPVGTQLAQIETLRSTRACRSCNLSGASLPGLDLNGCVLLDAILIGTDFTGADLRNCQFQKSDLSNANLTRADLSAADLTQATLTNAILTDAILTNVKGFQPP